MNFNELHDEINFACEQGDLEALEYFLTSPNMKIKANVNSTNTVGHTALMSACKYNQLEVVKYLLTSPNLKIKASIYSEDSFGRDIFNHLCQENNIEILDYLLTEPNLNIDIHRENDCGETIFIKACKYGKLDIVKYLLTSPNLKEHSKIVSKTLNGMLEAYFSNNIEIVDYLLTSSDLKEHANINSVDKKNWGLLIRACHRGDKNFVKYLLTSPNLKEHVDIYAKNEAGETALMLACDGGHLDLVKFLLQFLSPEDLNVKDKGRNFTALCYAICSGHIKTVKYLLNEYDSKSLINQTTFDINTLGNIFYYYRNNNKSAISIDEMIAYLITYPEFKSQIESQDKDKKGYNLLMNVCMSKNIEIAKMLILDTEIKIDTETIIWLSGKNYYGKKYDIILDIIKIKELHQKLDNNINSVENSPSKKIKV